jgi:hypothetical protein
MKTLQGCTVILLLLWAAPIVAPGLSAQEPGEEWVPMELVRLATEVNFPGVPPRPSEILVGVLPTELAEILELPPGSRIIGGMRHSLFSTGFVAVPADASEVHSWLTEALVDAGWVPMDQNLPPGGFEPWAGLGLQFCLDEEVSLSAWATPNPDGGSYLRTFHVGVTPFGSPCRAPESEWAERARDRIELARSLMPALRAPSGATMVDTGGGGGTDRWNSLARVIGDIGLEALADHFEGQLVEGGWTRVEEVIGVGVVARTYLVTDDEGGRWHGSLTVGTPGPGEVRFLEVSLWSFGSSGEGG